MLICKSPCQQNTSSHRKMGKSSPKETAATMSPITLSPTLSAAEFVGCLGSATSGANSTVDCGNQIPPTLGCSTYCLCFSSSSFERATTSTSVTPGKSL